MNEKRQAEIPEQALTTRRAVTTESGALPTLPSISDEQLWLVPAERSHVTAAVSHVLAACEPGAQSERVALFARMVALRCYTAAELAYAAQELPFDQVVNDKLRFNRPVMPADFERIIKLHRKKRAKLRRAMPLADAEELAMEFPDELSIEHFHCTGFDDDNRALYRYFPKRTTRTPDPDPNPQDQEARPYAGERESKVKPLGEMKAIRDQLPKDENE
jgi:hypothetical protein